MNKQHIKRGFQFSHRDFEIIKWVNGFGFANCKQIGAHFNISTTKLYPRLKKMIDQNFLHYDRVHSFEAGFYYPTRKATAIAQDELPSLSSLNVSKLPHDIHVLDIALLLTKRYGHEINFIPERRLKRAIALTEFSKEGHISDGEFTLDGKRIALEVELSHKGSDKRWSILEFYALEFDIKELWYICRDWSIANEIKEHAHRFPFVKISFLNEYLEEHAKIPA